MTELTFVPEEARRYARNRPRIIADHIGHLVLHHAYDDVELAEDADLRVVIVGGDEISAEAAAKKVAAARGYDHVDFVHRERPEPSEGAEVFDPDEDEFPF